MPNTNFVKSERSQIIVVFALGITMLVLAVGLAIDAGLCYVAKAKLSAAVDGACLAGMKTLQQGQSTATTIAQDVFYANYGANPPIPAVTFPVNSSGNQQVEVAATTNVHTLFMQVIPNLRTVAVSATAVATRGKLIMTIVLDRSGSMCGGTGKNKCPGTTTGDDGGDAIQAAVPTFVNNFDQTSGTGDEVGLVSFSSNSTVNFAINYGFKTSINGDVGSMVFTGGTFGTGIGTGSLLSSTVGPPLSLAGAQNDGVTIPSGQNVVKVVVYFTDGLMNAVQDNFHCMGKNNSTLTLLNYGGYDTGNNVAILDPTSATNQFDTWVPGTSSYFSYDGNSSHKCTDSSGNYVTKFPSQQSGTQVAFGRSAVTTEAKWRANKTATALRSEASHPNYIYTIGLGSAISGDSTTQMFLKEIANDPTADTYNSSQAVGEFFLVPDCPSTPATTCNNEVMKVFQTIAAKVLLRLTQ